MTSTTIAITARITPITIIGVCSGVSVGIGVEIGVGVGLSNWADFKGEQSTLFSSITNCSSYIPLPSRSLQASLKPHPSGLPQYFPSR